jgi:hypothetical protein
MTQGNAHIGNTQEHVPIQCRLGADKERGNRDRRFRAQWPGTCSRLFPPTPATIPQKEEKTHG